MKGNTASADGGGLRLAYRATATLVACDVSFNVGESWWCSRSTLSLVLSLVTLFSTGNNTVDYISRRKETTFSQEVGER